MPQNFSVPLRQSFKSTSAVTSSDPITEGIKFGLSQLHSTLCGRRRHLARHFELLGLFHTRQLHIFNSYIILNPRSEAEMVKASCVCGKSAYDFNGKYQAFVSLEASNASFDGESDLFVCPSLHVTAYPAARSRALIDL